ncbi:MAG: TetR/AcrR family transcriptional regulator [Arenibacterium sp.]
MPDDILKETEPRHGNSKVTRNDWLRAARDTLVTKGVGDVKILTLSGELGVARSSFYWYFSDRADLLAALLADWEARNTRCIVEKCGQVAGSIGEAACNFFECFIDDALFDQRLDFAVREWSRRDNKVREMIDAADQQRLEAVTLMFARHGFTPADADARARILYFMQLGYHALDVREGMETRMSRIEAYLKGFTGETATPDVIDAFKQKAFRVGKPE